MLIPRFITNKIEGDLGKQKVILLYGTRRTGKTTIIEYLATKYKNDTLILPGEDLQIAEILKNRTVKNYRRIIGDKKIVVIDEAQAVPEIGMCLKFMIDQIQGITIIATGSSSFDFVYRTGEPLVGRNIVYQLHPLAQVELSVREDHLTTRLNLEQRLIYGSYPELWHMESTGDQEQYLQQLIQSYLLKDLLILENVKGANVLYKLLQLLAWQVGSEVSTVELGESLQMSKNTVDRYLDLLSKVFIIYPLGGFSRNLRKEVTKRKKWYFYDNGIRNALIRDFRPLQARNDIGQLWEQYVLGERMKFNSSRNHIPRYYFWRTYDGQEIDFLELDNRQNIQAIECKWRERGAKPPAAFSKAYPEARYEVVNKSNYLDWIT
ncbi:MAG: AAA family ATPase [Balneolaceae bacterium]|nr:AAA family ATPase [Balneolaceae bacterium]